MTRRDELVSTSTDVPLIWVAFVDDSLLIGHDGKRVRAWNHSLSGLTPVPIEVEVPAANWVPAVPFGGSEEFLRAAAISPDRTRVALARGSVVVIYRFSR